MEFIGEEKRDVKHNGVVVRSDVTYLVYKLLKGDRCKKPDQKVAFQKSSGFRNPYDHLSSCYKSKAKINREVIQGRSLSQIERVQTLTPSERERAMLSYLKFVVLGNAPLYSVADEVYRDFSKYKSGFSRRYFNSVMYALVELVEKKITSEMRFTRGSIQHDGWTLGSTHFKNCLDLSEEEYYVDDKQKAIWTTWSMNMDEVHNHPESLKIIRACAMLGTAPIPEQLMDKLVFRCSNLDDET